MSGSESEGVLDDLARIVHPSESPPEAPDEFARREEIIAGRMADLSPQKRNTHLYERTVVSLEKQCDRLTEEKQDFLDRYFGVQRELGLLIPRHAALKQAYRDARATNGLVALLMVLGGTLVSVAGAISQSSWKERLLWAGGASFLSGFLFALQANIRNQPNDY